MMGYISEADKAILHEELSAALSIADPVAAVDEALKCCFKFHWRDDVVEALREAQAVGFVLSGQGPRYYYIGVPTNKPRCDHRPTVAALALTTALTTVGGIGGFMLGAAVGGVGAAAESARREQYYTLAYKRTIDLSWIRWRRKNLKQYSTLKGGK